MLQNLPPEVQATLTEFRACEFSTLAKDGTPITWPVIAVPLLQRNQFLVTASIGLPQKALNARRRSQVSLLYSDPTASGLADPVHVLVQGDATVSELTTWNDDLDAMYEILSIRQPSSQKMGADPVTRWLMDWYYMRLLIYVTPRRVLWWPGGDYTRSPQSLEASHVG